MNRSRRLAPRSAKDAHVPCRPRCPFRAYARICCRPRRTAPQGCGAPRQARSLPLRNRRSPSAPEHAACPVSPSIRISRARAAHREGQDTFLPFPTGGAAARPEARARRSYRLCAGGSPPFFQACARTPPCGCGSGICRPPPRKPRVDPSFLWTRSPRSCPGR